MTEGVRITICNSEVLDELKENEITSLNFINFNLKLNDIMQ
jgi:hypothetical protein|tara:strand:+ start:213 stop:335 length:123 start_codon:yes stop_codon:yes gene_type:complete